MAPYQNLSIILGHRTKNTGSLGFSFQTDVDTNDHRVYHVESFAQPCGIRTGDFIVGLNHLPLVSSESHTNLAQQIKTIQRPFTLNILRPQDVMVDERPKLRQQHRDWFVAFCRKYRVERSVIEATLRLRRASTCVSFNDAIVASGRNENLGHDGDHTSMAAKRHLVVCLRVMVKFIDDRMGVTSLSALAGFKLSDDEWMKLEFELCNQVHWNLVYFCHSSKSNISATADPTLYASTENQNPNQAYGQSTDPYALIHQNQRPAKLSVAQQIALQHTNFAATTEQDEVRERDFWEPLPPPTMKRKRADNVTPPTGPQHTGSGRQFGHSHSVAPPNVSKKNRPVDDPTLNPIHRLAKAKAFSSQVLALASKAREATTKESTTSSASSSSLSTTTTMMTRSAASATSSGSTSTNEYGYGCSVNKPNLTLRLENERSSGSSDSSSDSGSGESDGESCEPVNIVTSHAHLHMRHKPQQEQNRANVQKIHFSQISACTNTTQEKPQQQQQRHQYQHGQYHPHDKSMHTNPTSSSTPMSYTVHDPNTNVRGHQAPSITQYQHQHHQQLDYDQQHNTQHQPHHVHVSNHHRYIHQQNLQSQQNQFDQKRHQQEMVHHQHNAHQHQHNQERARHVHHGHGHDNAAHPGFLGFFRARCQSIVSSLNRTPQVAAP